jgi:DNA-binding beta-propeller fold protein YncE
VFITCSWLARRGRATLRRSVLARAITLALALAGLAGCGSAGDLPPAAVPARSPPLTERPAGRVVPLGTVRDKAPSLVTAVDQGRALAVLSPRARELTVYDRHTRRRIGRAGAGVGPTQVVGGRGGLIYVVDTAGEGLLVFELRPHLRLTRRLPILGSPYGIASDPVGRRLWVATTRTNRLVELADGARPHRLRSFPTVRQPDAVAVDSRRHRVYVTGRGRQILDVPDG